MRLLLFFVALFSLACCGGPEPRRPVKVKSGSFIKESAERNKKLLEREEKMIKDIIALDTIHNYIATADGSWYYYENKRNDEDYMPRPDDLVTLTYNIVSFGNDTIYSKETLGITNYKVDKQEFFPGFRSGVKLLKEGETATFLFPSSRAYGYLGDKNKVGPNVPIKSTLSILKIEKQRDSI
ncbi:gliding motility-associated peptidyl-prolyl isomerase GldI [Spongiimicrobium sp. 3-5]|uniref:gliding motility-associated peptidyl-prolyl isomerase GldI n=1 Tax=Spongiimicrobium sp. 3-5 TaxID=3332596 RepID=UPI0039815383